MNAIWTNKKLLLTVQILLNKTVDQVNTNETAIFFETHPSFLQMLVIFYQSYFTKWYIFMSSTAMPLSMLFSPPTVARLLSKQFFLQHSVIKV